MIIVAVKLFSILMNLDKIVLQVAVFLTKLSIQYPVHLFIINLLSKQKHMLESKMTMKL